VRRFKKINRKIARLEKLLGIRGPTPIPPDVKTMYAFIHREGQSPTLKEIEEQAAKIREDLLAKYGRRILKRLCFTTVKIVGPRQKREDAMNVSKDGEHESDAIS